MDEKSIMIATYFASQHFSSKFVSRKLETPALKTLNFVCIQ